LKEARRGAGSQHVKGHEKTKAGVLASNGEGGEAFVPTLFLGDLFTPCNSLGLFRDHVSENIPWLIHLLKQGIDGGRKIAQGSLRQRLRVES